MKFKEGDILEFDGEGSYSAKKGARGIFKKYYIGGNGGEYVWIDWIRDNLSNGQMNGGYNESQFTKVGEVGDQLKDRIFEENKEKVMKITIEDLKKPGAKLPFIPAGTEYRCERWGIESKNDFLRTPNENNVSYGVVIYGGEEYIIADKKSPEIKDNHYMFKTSDIERLAIEQGIIEKKEETMETQTITRTQLKEIHDIACSTWKNKIEKFAQRNPFGDTIEFTNSEVNEMFAAATPSQLPVIERLFKRPTKEVDLSDEKVDGMDFFKRYGGNGESLIAVRKDGEFESKAFFLNSKFNWEIKEDEYGMTCLIPTRK